jgi:hypothetical protein
MKGTVMNKHLGTIALLAATLATVAVGSQAAGQPATSRQPSGSSDNSYTVLDHPSKPCRLSVEAVANWGETSAHLPQACTYDE